MRRPSRRPWKVPATRSWPRTRASTGSSALRCPRGEEDDPHGVDLGEEYHGSEHDDEYVASGDSTEGGRRMKPDLVVCPCSGGGGTRWTVTVCRPASVAGVDPERQSTERQRDRLFRDYVLATVGGHLVDRQGEYLASGDPMDLTPLSLETIAAGVRDERERAGGVGVGPGRREIDVSRVSRVMKDSAIELPTGEVVPLRALAPTRETQVRRFVAAIFREDRPGEGRMGLVESDDVAGRVGEKLGVGRNTLRRNLGGCHPALPLDPRRRLEAYAREEDWWTRSRF